MDNIQLVSLGNVRWTQDPNHKSIYTNNHNITSYDGVQSNKKFTHHLSSKAFPLFAKKMKMLE